MRILLLGSTDLTLALANRIHEMGLTLAGCSSVGTQFNISYSTSAVKNLRCSDMPGWAKTHQIPWHPYSSSRELERFATEVNADFGLVVGWYHMVNRRLRDQLSKGCAGIHASMLPSLRGGAPLNWAILQGLSVTGVSLFELGDGVDDGGVYGQVGISIDDRETIGTLVKKAELASLELVETFLPKIAAGEVKPVIQQGSPSYCQQRKPEDGEIDWSRSSLEIDRLIRAVGRPYGGAYGFLDGNKVVIWEAERFDAVQVWGVPGQVALIPGLERPLICSADGVLRITEASFDDGSDALETLMKANHRRFERESCRTGN